MTSYEQARRTYGFTRQGYVLWRLRLLKVDSHGSPIRVFGLPAHMVDTGVEILITPKVLAGVTFLCGLAVGRFAL